MIQERINTLKRESQKAEHLLLENIKSITNENHASSMPMSTNIEDNQSKAFSLSGQTALSLAKLILTLATGLSSTPKSLSRFKFLLSMLK